MKRNRNHYLAIKLVQLRSVLSLGLIVAVLAAALAAAPTARAQTT